MWQTSSQAHIELVSSQLICSHSYQSPLSIIQVPTLPGRRHLLQLLCSPADNENIKNRAVWWWWWRRGEEGSVRGGRLTLTKRLHFLALASYLVVIKSRAGIRLQRLQSPGEQGGGRGKRHDPPGGLPGPFLSS